MKNKNWYVYVLQCANTALYTGMTNDITKRLARHTAGLASKYTRSHLPVTLVYTEKHPTKSAALKREACIKKWSRKKKLILISGDRN